MREILFRGKDAVNGEWLHGDLGRRNSRVEPKLGSVGIVDEHGNYRVVENATIGQFSGLTDKNGKRIFEGDIISTDLGRGFLVVEFNGGAFVFNCNDGGDDYYDHINSSSELINEYKYGEIIGNIHDNQELLEAK